MKILFLGETENGSAEYLRDCLLYFKHKVTHIQSHENINMLDTIYDTIIVSDYPAKNMSNNVAIEIMTQVQHGTRFIMLGGWSSYNGFGKNYFNHKLAEILPVDLNKKDDRQNIPQGLMLCPDKNLKSKSYMDWSHPPIICGYNQTKPKKDTSTLVWMKPINSNGKTISLQKPLPLLVKGYYGRGTTLACMTDVAPHWCGGLVDWGTKRVKLIHVEIGNIFLSFIRFLLEA